MLKTVINTIKILILLVHLFLIQGKFVGCLTALHTTKAVLYAE